MPIPSVARFSRQRREHFIKKTNNNNVKSNVVGPSGDFRKNEKKYDQSDPQFHLQSLGNPKNHNIVLLRLPFCNVIKFNLRHLRILLMAMNLVILYTAVILYQSFEKIDSMKRNATKGLTRSEKDQDSFYTSNHWLHEYYHVIDHTFNHADQILFGQSIILIMYYVVFGLVVAWNFGSSFSDLKFSVYGYPPIVVMTLTIFITAYEFIDAREHMIHMNVSFVKKSQQVSYKRLTAILEMRHMLIESGNQMATSMIISGVVIIIQGLFPFFMYDLPLQRKMDIDEFVRNSSLLQPKIERVTRMKMAGFDDENNNPNEKIKPYRSLSAAYTVMLQLCRPEVRDLHRMF